MPNDFHEMISLLRSIQMTPDRRPKLVKFLFPHFGAMAVKRRFQGEFMTGMAHSANTINMAVYTLSQGSSSLRLLTGFLAVGATIAAFYSFRSSRKSYILYKEAMVESVMSD